MPPARLGQRPPSAPTQATPTIDAVVHVPAEQLQPLSLGAQSRNKSFHPMSDSFTDSQKDIGAAVEQDSGIGEIFELSVAVRQEAGRALALLWRSVEFEELVAQDGRARVVFTPEQLAAVGTVAAAKTSGVSLATEFESAVLMTSSGHWKIKQWGRTSDAYPELPSDIREVIGSLIRSLTEGLAFVESFKAEIDEIVGQVRRGFYLVQSLSDAVRNRETPPHPRRLEPGQAGRRSECLLAPHD